MRVQLVGGLIFLALWSVALLAQAGAPNVQKPANTQKASAAPKTAHQLFVEDQEDLRGGANGGPRFSEEQYHQRVQVREATLRSMLAAGEIKTGDDFRDAAYIFQHGNSANDCLFAHILAMEAMARGTESTRFVAAATLDRLLQMVKQPQVFGTQYITDPNVRVPVRANASPWTLGRTLEPYNESLLPDSVRTDFCVPELGQQKQNVAMFNAGKWPRETMHPPCH